MIHTVHYIPLDPLEYPFINIPWKTPGFHGPKGDVESHDVATGHHCLGGGGLLRGHWCHETAGLGGSLEQRWRVGSKHLGISMEKYRDVWHIWYYMIYDIRYTFIYIYMYISYMTSHYSDIPRWEWDFYSDIWYMMIQGGHEIQYHWKKHPIKELEAVFQGILWWWEIVGSGKLAELLVI